MFQGIKNILTVSKYETKLLKRSWFFKTFSVLAIFVILIRCCSFVIDSNNMVGRFIPSTVPYLCLLVLNVGQAVVSIFLSSEYLKRDKQLDTSEVFYTRPLSNAEYLLGKMLATLKVFFTLDFIIMAMIMIICLIKYGFGLDYLSYLWFFLLLIVPTLVFIVGLSTALMLIIKNQAMTLVVLLSYIGVTLFYIDSIYYYLFDYIGYNLPMFKSMITGFGNLTQIITHRACYLFLGMGFILVSISLFRRLPNSRHSLLPWRIAAVLFLFFGLFMGYRHVSHYTNGDKFRSEMIQQNNTHVHDAKMEVDSCYINVTQDDAVLIMSADMLLRPTTQDSCFVFSLNPGYQVTDVTSDGKPIAYSRDMHLIIVDFGREIMNNQQVQLTIKYEGIIDERICYLDIPEKQLLENIEVIDPMHVCKRYAFQDNDYVLLTPESYWYPRPGVTYSNESSEWQQSFFTNYRVQVTPNPGLVPISQGAVMPSADSTSYTFTSDYPLQSVSLIIGNYVSRFVDVDSTRYSLWVVDEFDDRFSVMDSITDTIPYMIRNVRNAYEGMSGLTYPFDRFTMVEVPAHFASYSRAWTKSQEFLQPEMVLMVEKGYNIYEFDFETQMKYMIGRNRNDMSDRDARASILYTALYFMYSKSGGYSFQNGGRGSYNLVAKPNPYYIFPMMYNFRYNIYSSRWPIANRMTEIFLQGRDDNQGWMRETNGMSSDEKALLLLQKYNFDKLVSDPDRTNLLDNIIGLKTQALFAEPQMRMGVEAFHDTLFNIIKANEFSNISFEALLDYLESVSGTDFTSIVEHWNEPMKLAEYTIGTPVITNINNETEDLYQSEITIENTSDNTGYVRLELVFYVYNEEQEDKPTSWIIKIEPHRAVRMVSHWLTKPNSFLVNTLASSNLPQEISVTASGSTQGYVLTPEGIYDVSGERKVDDGEIIVDNEDKDLFSLSKPEQTGYLTKWIDKAAKDDEEFKYKGFSTWRIPFKWTPVTDSRFYGTSVRSAYIIRSGDGSQFAKWRVPVKCAGTYDVYYYVIKQAESNIRWRRNNNGNNGKRVTNDYTFDISQFNISETTSLNIRRAEEGWNLIGTFRFEDDTVAVTLTDKTGQESVIADAVRFVKR